MLEDFYLPMRLAAWNRARSVWETGQMQFLCEHSVPFLATWPTSGMTRSGAAFELPTPELHTDDSGCSYLPTPMTINRTSQKAQTGRETSGPFRGGASYGLEDVVTLLKTPTSQLAINGGSQHPDKRKQGGHGPTLADEVEHLLPTPVVSDRNGGNDSRREHQQLRSILLPTPQVADATGGHASRSGARSGELLLPGVVKTLRPHPTQEYPYGLGNQGPGTGPMGERLI